MNKMLLFLWLACVALSCANQGSSDKEVKNYQESKEKLAAREVKYPLEFLSIASKDKRNLLGQTVVKGEIINTATVAAYKNVRIKLLYFRDGMQVANHEQVEDEMIKPGNSNSFKAKYFTPKKTDSVAVSIMSAEVGQ